MKYQSYDLGQLNGNETVEVTLKGNSANVKLMDSINFSNYKSNRKYNFFGGHVTKSPFRISIPRAGRWFVVIDLGGYAGNVSSSVRIL
ncbi:DUF1883 domain-containing protein [Chryseobacterium sp. 3008163]|uniref:DUF1883 domain-containing protein n=1 Tax=Chryseobacterium sp. 3008163 TaxID=2478663 RepID=UPI000F0C2A16|nr:DUF1883 domain-containing protein [Chryseobacterium sp. 3008163]AYN02172.1 DUF1883 domain-containing protein [Chryseobacterium sp. 3008163]